MAAPAPAANALAAAFERSRAAGLAAFHGRPVNGTTRSAEEVASSKALRELQESSLAKWIREPAGVLPAELTSAQGEDVSRIANLLYPLDTRTTWNTRIQLYFSQYVSGATAAATALPNITGLLQPYVNAFVTAIHSDPARDNLRTTAHHAADTFWWDAMYYHSPDLVARVAAVLDDRVRALFVADGTAASVAAWNAHVLTIMTDALYGDKVEPMVAHMLRATTTSDSTLRTMHAGLTAFVRGRQEDRAGKHAQLLGLVDRTLRHRTLAERGAYAHSDVAKQIEIELQKYRPFENGNEGFQVQQHIGSYVSSFITRDNPIRPRTPAAIAASVAALRMPQPITAAAAAERMRQVEDLMDHNQVPAAMELIERTREDLAFTAQQGAGTQQ